MRDRASWPSGTYFVPAACRPSAEVGRDRRATARGRRTPRRGAIAFRGAPSARDTAMRRGGEPMVARDLALRAHAADPRHLERVEPQQAADHEAWSRRPRRTAPPCALAEDLRHALGEGGDGASAPAKMYMDRGLEDRDHRADPPRIGRSPRTVATASAPWGPRRAAPGVGDVRPRRRPSPPAQPRRRREKPAGRIEAAPSARASPRRRRRAARGEDGDERVARVARPDEARADDAPARRPRRRRPRAAAGARSGATSRRRSDAAREEHLEHPAATSSRRRAGRARRARRRRAQLAAARVRQPPDADAGRRVAAAEAARKRRDASAPRAARGRRALGRVVRSQGPGPVGHAQQPCRHRSAPPELARGRGAAAAVPSAAAPPRRRLNGDDGRRGEAAEAALKSSSGDAAIAVAAAESGARAASAACRPPPRPGSGGRRWLPAAAVRRPPRRHRATSRAARPGAAACACTAICSACTEFRCARTYLREVL